MTDAEQMKLTDEEKIEKAMWILDGVPLWKLWKVAIKWLQIAQLHGEAFSNLGGVDGPRVKGDILHWKRYDGPMDAIIKGVGDESETGSAEGRGIYQRIDPEGTPEVRSHSNPQEKTEEVPTGSPNSGK
jgi:hypothetical protein